jgi:hypothetical protein
MPSVLPSHLAVIELPEFLAAAGLDLLGGAR